MLLPLSPIGPFILTLGERAPSIGHWIIAHLASHIEASHSLKEFSLYWNNNSVFNRLFHHATGLLFQMTGYMVRIE